VVFLSLTPFANVGSVALTTDSLLTQIWRYRLTELLSALPSQSRIFSSLSLVIGLSTLVIGLLISLNL
jgi:hypothetical protein